VTCGRYAAPCRHRPSVSPTTCDFVRDETCQLVVCCRKCCQCILTGLNNLNHSTQVSFCSWKKRWNPFSSTVSRFGLTKTLSSVKRRHRIPNSIHEFIMFTMSMADTVWWHFASTPSLKFNCRFQGFHLPRHFSSLWAQFRHTIGCWIAGWLKGS
jgi:hypothetical protein